MPQVVREITINADASAVTAVAGWVSNLPEWTTFFRSVGSQRDGRYPTETVLGPSETWIELSADGPGTVLTICSVIGERLEVATVELAPGDRGVTARFTVTLPDDLGADAVSEQREEMGEELARLRDLVEVGHVRA
jgi:hypothetical protein